MDLRPARVNQILATDITTPQMIDILDSLEFGVKTGKKITLGTLRRSREDRNRNMPIMFLLCKWDEQRRELLPGNDLLLEPGMQLLVAATEESKSDFEYIVNNYYELQYVLTGKG